MCTQRLAFGRGGGGDGDGGGDVGGGGGIDGDRGNSWRDPLLTESSICGFIEKAFPMDGPMH